MKDQAIEKRESDRYKTLLEIGQSLISITDLDQLLKKIVDVVAKEIQAERALIILRHPISGEMRIANSTANVDTSTLEDAMIFSKTIVTDVVNKGKSIFSRDVIKDGTYSKTDSVMNLKIRSLMCVPLVAKQNGDIIGTVYVDNRSVGNIFSKEDLALLESFANLAGMAIENAHLYELAIIDELTKCYVRRYFEQRIREEFSRAVRQGGSLSVLMIDIDNFKEINDRYGHQVGDMVLKEIAATIKRNLRTYDLIARLGGDEFAIILPDVGQFQDAFSVAEKIRNAAAQLLLPGIQNKITVSIGISCYPLHLVNNVETLMKKSDVALYKAKQLGRNNSFFYGQQEMLELFGQAGLQGTAPGDANISSLFQRLEAQKKDNSEEIDFLVGKSIEALKDLNEQISHLKIMAVQMNSQIHQLSPTSPKIREVVDMLHKLLQKHQEAEKALQDYYQMLEDLPLVKNHG